MTCPYFTPDRRGENALKQPDETLGISKEENQTYSEVLKLSTILNTLELRGETRGRASVHDEHFFLIIHQAFELWFKQILHEVDSAREIFMSKSIGEKSIVKVTSRINRTVLILKLLTQQIATLETITQKDFRDIRRLYEGVSGFQSFQFRMLEVRLGVKKELRVAYGGENFLSVFVGEERDQLEVAMNEPSLLDLVNDWLERNYGRKPQMAVFWAQYMHNIGSMLNEMNEKAKKEKDMQARSDKISQHSRQAKLFNSVFDEKLHDSLLKTGDRRLTYHAMKGTFVICLYGEEPGFHLPFRLLQSLMDVDNELMKFRYSHACMVQRLIGGKAGTGGSSGYQYLRSTCGDRYKVFLDLFNLATYLIPKECVPALTPEMSHAFSNRSEETPQLPTHAGKNGA